MRKQPVGFDCRDQAVGAARTLLVALVLVFPCVIASPSSAQESGPSHFALPFEFEGDYGAANGDALLLRLQPLWRTPIRQTWSLIHLDLITLAEAPPYPGNPINPDPAPGTGSVTGLSDLIHLSVYTPAPKGGFVWGIGGILQIPTATDDALGSGKWAAGPAARLTWRGEQWTVGAILGQRWSFAGDLDRADVNALLLRGAIRRPLGSRWFFVSAPVINANWNATSGNRWLVPVGGGIGRTFQLDGQPWAVSVQGYYNAVRPDGAPDWSLRLAFVAHIPREWFRRDD